MTITVDQVATTSFRATVQADRLAGEVKDLLGFGTHNIAARLAIARSLAIPEPPLLAQGEPGRTIRGEALFGTGDVLAAWLSLLIEYEGRPIETIGALQQCVRDHWVRGTTMLGELLAGADRSAITFWRRLAETALPSGRPPAGEGETTPRPGPMPRLIDLPLGPVSVDMSSGESVRMRPVTRGASPHVAVMGGVGSGKTRNAVFMLKALRAQTPVALVAFDFKGDMTDPSNALESAFAATVVSPPHDPVPLDVLALSERSEIAIKLAAQRLRDTLATLRGAGFGPVQRSLFAQAAEQALRRHEMCRLEDIRDELDTVYQVQGRQPDGVSGTIEDLCRLPLFDPQLAPAAFFDRSWIIRLSQDLPELVRVSIVTLVMDALDRWLNSLPDSQVDSDGNRALRVVALIDEAHRILGSKLPGLSNLVRLSRSKGGMIWLISQSPDDFEGEDDDFLAEMGLVMAFVSNAPPGATRRIFGDQARLAALGPGEAWVKLRGEQAQRVRVWSP
jgi:hypothetical protein